MSRKSSGETWPQLLTFQLYRLISTLTLWSKEYFQARHDLAPIEVRILICVGDLKSATVSQVSDLVMRDKAWVSRSVDRLVARGLFAKEPAADHGRRVHITLTDAGWEVYEPVIRVMVERNEQLLQEFSTAERALLHEWLDRVERHARKELGLLERMLGRSLSVVADDSEQLGNHIKGMKSPSKRKLNTGRGGKRKTSRSR